MQFLFCPAFGISLESLIDWFCVSKLALTCMAALVSSKGDGLTIDHMGRRSVYRQLRNVSEAGRSASIHNSKYLLDNPINDVTNTFLHLSYADTIIAKTTFRA